MNSKHSTEAILKFGEYIGHAKGGDAVESASNVRGSGGGIIFLSSHDDISNGGGLSCKGTENKQFSGGTVYIMTDEVFENRGHIDAGQSGQIIIGCARFLNKGEITTAPDLMIGRSFLVESARTFKGKKMEYLKDLFTSGLIGRGDINPNSFQWTYDGTNEAVCVTVNQECYLTGIGVFDCDGRLEIECRIYEGENGSGVGNVIYEEPKQMFEFGGWSNKPFELRFSTAVLLKKNVKYTVEIKQKNYGGKSRCIENAQTTVELGGLTVTVSDARSSKNCTTAKRGALPCFFFARV